MKQISTPPPALSSFPGTPTIAPRWIHSFFRFVSFFSLFLLHWYQTSFTCLLKPSCTGSGFGRDSSLGNPPEGLQSTGSPYRPFIILLMSWGARGAGEKNKGDGLWHSPQGLRSFTITNSYSGDLLYPLIFAHAICLIGHNFPSYNSDAQFVYTTPQRLLTTD